MQLIYIKKGKEAIFDEFERLAMPIIEKHNGLLMLRIRPQENSFLFHSIEKPYEVHLVAFQTIKDFENFQNDDVRKKFMYLKDQSIQSSILIQGFQT